MVPITTTSEEARAHFVLGRTAAHHYQFAQARDHLDAALRADPDCVMALLHRGGSEDEPSRVRAYLDRADALRDHVSEPERVMLDAFRAFLLRRDHERAIELLSPLADAHSDDPYLAAYLGFRYLNLRRRSEAAAQFRRALDRDPEFVQAYQWLGAIALAQDDLEAAEAMFVRYLEGAPDQPRPHDSMGRIELRRARYEQAAQHFERALELEPRFVESLEHLARARLALENARLTAAVRDRDVATLTAGTTDDGWLRPPHGDVVEGAEAIARFWAAALGRGVEGVELLTDEVYAGADGASATEIGRYTSTSDAGERETGTYVVVWLREENGWRRHRSIWTAER
jgi:tetratricopeptide (TPR) repeat protein